MATAIVVPFFNETSRWNPEYWDRLKHKNIFLYFVDDGSTDSTGDLLSTVSHAHIVTLEKNKGKAEAVRHGIYAALSSGRNFEVVGFLDADGAFNTSEVIGITEDAPSIFAKGFQAIWTSRVKLSGRSISRTYLRHLIGRIIGAFLATSLKDFPYDSQCGFKLYRVDDKMKDSFLYTSQTRWFFELEHLANYGIQNGKLLKIWEIPLMSWADIKGSKIYSAQSIIIVREIMFVYKQLRSLKLCLK
jgi:dolichyl-phosphate beta-glucosyltransferase